MQKQVKSKSPLQTIFLQSIPEKQDHFRNQWFQFTNLSRNQFYERLKKPRPEDYALWQIACDDLILSERLLKLHELEHDFSKVKIFELPEMYIKEIEAKFNV